MCGLKRYTDWECGHTGQPSAASEQSSLTLGVGSNMTSKNGSNVAARSLPLIRMEDGDRRRQSALKVPKVYQQIGVFV